MQQFFVFPNETRKSPTLNRNETLTKRGKTLQIIHVVTLQNKMAASPEITYSHLMPEQT